MLKLKFVKLLSFLVSLAGLFVMIIWIFDIGFLKNIVFNFETMNFTTALCFFAGGIALYSAAEENNESSLIVQTILPSAILLILLVSSTLSISYLFKFSIGLNGIFIQEKAGIAKVFISNQTSIPTVFNFILIALAGVFIFIGSKRYLFYLGAVVAPVGGVAAFGYIINQPILYYFIANKNVAMLFSTAVLFMLTGVGFILCGKTALK